MESTIRLFRDTLRSAFRNWLDKNQEAIGEKWYNRLLEQLAKVDCETAIEIMATSMWMFNMIADFGVLAGIGPDSVNVAEIREGLDKQSTVRLLHLIKACMNLQYLPKEIATMKIPVITANKFSLKLFTEQQIQE